MPKKKSTKVEPIVREVRWGDEDGTVDQDFKDDQGRKTVEIRNANKGLLIRMYDKEANCKTCFLTVEAIKDFVLAQSA